MRGVGGFQAMWRGGAGLFIYCLFSKCPGEDGTGRDGTGAPRPATADKHRLLGDTHAHIYTHIHTEATDRACVSGMMECV